ncbi:MAG: CAP domain-containing protein [Acidimicrobiales bacterium]
MDRAARNWSETMDRTGDFHHSSLPYGENIAWWSAGSATPEEAARKMHDLWVHSPGHFANMTSSGYPRRHRLLAERRRWHATHVFDF